MRFLRRLVLVFVTFCALGTIAFAQTYYFRRLPKMNYPHDDVAGIDIATGDVDGDGDIDMLIGKSSGWNDTLMLNDGFGGLRPAPLAQMPMKPRGYVSYSVALGDLDGDGDLDAVFGTLASSSHGVRISLNNGKGFFRDAGRACLPPPRQSYVPVNDLCLSDVDRDGDLDLVLFLFVSNASTLRLWLNDGKGNFKDVTSKQVQSLSGALERGFLKDMDGDGYPDIVFVPPFGAGPWLYLNNGKGSFSDASRVRIGNRDPILGPSIGDVDGDGDIDIVCGVQSVSPASMKVWINDGKGHFKEEGASRTPKGSENFFPLPLIDLDSDGDLDLFLIRVHLYPKGTSSRVYLNDGKGKFSDASRRWFTSYTSERLQCSALVDLDSDGDPEFLFGRHIWRAPPTRHHWLFINTHHQICAPKEARRGVAYPIEIHGQEKEVVALAMGLVAKRQYAGSLGTLGLDLSASVVLPGTILLRSSGTAIVSLAIPRMPSLLGQNLYTQALFFDFLNPKASSLSNVIHDVVK
ncbi:MAG: hypothetical protein CSA62_06485 [Planctomycetota bacterium]|nr:MAG: hypothetical protein CSA62_06485 [Planctomycetota bacterium]